MFKIYKTFSKVGFNRSLILQCYRIFDFVICGKQNYSISVHRYMTLSFSQARCKIPIPFLKADSDKERESSL